MDDLYAELDVPRDADATAIRKAYRKASKRAHPDGGGSAEKFRKVSMALAVLSDPKRRKTYDETGRIEDDPVDNEKVHIVELAMAAVQAEIDAHGDGAIYVDIVDSARAKLKAQVAQVDNAIHQVSGRIRAMKRLDGRFKKKNKNTKDNILENLLRYRIAKFEQGNAKNAAMKRQLEAAITILGDYSFQVDPDGTALHKPPGGFFVRVNMRTT